MEEPNCMDCRHFQKTYFGWYVVCNVCLDYSRFERSKKDDKEDTMDSLPEFDVFPERMRDGTPTGRFCWEVFDAATQGPIDGGVHHDKQKAIHAGRVMRDHYERTMYYD